MDDEGRITKPIDFALTPRQRRHRTVTVATLVVIGAMVLFGYTSPFFHLGRASPLTPTLRKAIAVKGMFILGYWTVCFLFALSLFLVAWLEVREIRRKALAAQLEVVHELAGRVRDRLDPPT